MYIKRFKKSGDKLKFSVKHILVSALAVLLSAFCVLILLPGSGPDRELRLPARTLLRAIDNKDYGSAIENTGDGTHVWAIRAPANNQPVGDKLAGAVQFVLDIPYIVEASLDKSEDGSQDKTAVAEAKQSSPLSEFLESYGLEPPRLMAAMPQDFNDILDYHGHPERWQAAENFFAGYTRLKPRKAVREPSSPELKALPAMPKGAQLNYYRSLVENFSRRYNLNSSLVMAIIHSESDFSPALVSNKSAMGLMQLLPSTASDEVHRFLYGRRGQIGFEDLRNPEINIRYGTAYLHILLNRYFPNVLNRDVREVCAIASYNMGPNRFLRLYGSNNDLAVEKINNMSEDEFYEDLIRRLPVRETRFFVQKVRRMKKHYSSVP